ncbi:MAG TPA: hypothetical protein VHD33_08430 [Legionellaceae bacterium]|nr:hypothetical protein [Legionellaceae bacterium]
MPSTILLESLSLNELKVLLGHLKLGKSHLITLLDKESFDSLMQLGDIPSYVKKKITTTKAEKLGNVALILNTIITSCFGAWMGLYDFLGLKLDSYKMLIAITVLSAILGLLMSGISIKLTTTQVKDAIHNQKIHHLQVMVTKRILLKLNEEFKSAAQFLNNSVHYFAKMSNKVSVNLFLFQKIDDFYQWEDALTKWIQSQEHNEKINEFNNKRLLKIMNEIKELLNDYFSQPSLFRSLDDKTNVIRSQHGPFTTLLSVAKERLIFLGPEHNWFKHNYLTLLAGLPPTLLGGFSSMFVFLTGAPNLANEMGFTRMKDLLTHPISEFIEFTIALGLTCYYGWAFFYSNYRNHLRQMELTKTKRKLELLEKKKDFLEEKLALMLKLKQKTQQMIDIFAVK